MADITAQLNGLRIAPRKVRGLVALIKGKDVQVALDQLAHFTRRGGPPLVKLIKSGIANAQNNFKMEPEGLYIKAMTVDEGTKLKRFIPKGFGRAAAIEKKTSRIRLVLDTREPKEPVTPKT